MACFIHGDFCSSTGVKRRILSVLMAASLLWCAQSSLCPTHSASASVQSVSSRNFIVAVKPKQDFVLSATVYINLSLDLDLVAASPGYNMHYDDVYIDASSLHVEADYDGNGSSFIRPSTQMLVLRCNTDMTADEAFASLYMLPSSEISVVVGNAVYTGSNAFSFIYGMVGDIDADGDVDASDAVSALQYSVQQITLTETQKLVADVNNDGQINAADCQMILSFSTQQITSFWSDYSPVTLPTTQNANIKSGMVYRIENVFGKKGIRTLANTSSGATLKQKNYNYADTEQRYKFVYASNGAYRIIPMIAQTKVLSLSSGRLCVENYSGLSRQLWYIVPSSNGSLIINKSFPNQCLTLNGIVCEGDLIYSGVSSFGNKWVLHETTVKVNNYYDNGMLTRWGLTVAQMSSGIEGHMQFAADLYSELFDVTLDLSSSPYRYTSTADNCTGYATIAALNRDCQNSSHTIACKGNRTMWAQFYADHPGNANRLCIFWTGHYTWETRENEWVCIRDGGVFSNAYHSVMMLNIGGESGGSFANNERVKHTVCHEIAHELGAKDSYCRGETGTNCPPNCWNHGGAGVYAKDCLMGNMERPFSSYTADNMLCSQCKNDIIQHLNAVH